MKGLGTEEEKLLDLREDGKQFGFLSSAGFLCCGRASRGSYTVVAPRLVGCAGVPCQPQQGLREFFGGAAGKWGDGGLRLQVLKLAGSSPRAPLALSGSVSQRYPVLRLWSYWFPCFSTLQLPGVRERRAKGHLVGF